MMQRAKRLAIFSVLFMVSLLVPATYTKAEVVIFADPALEEAIRQQIGLPVGDIHDSDLELMDILQASGQGIVDISGIGHCINLEVLDLAENAIADISELGALPNLSMLDLGDNGLEDIGPVGDLTNLTSLSLAYNRFGDADLDEVLSSLGNLVYLNLSGNHLTHIGNITGLINLERLFLADNRISDISGLGNCSNLSYLNLHKNYIRDISVLAELDNLQFVDLVANDISDFSPVEGVPTVYRDTDSDDDNILDEWEVAYFGGLSHNGKGDADGDGLNDLREYQRGADPNNPDTDADDMPDGWEVDYRLDPLLNDASADADGDGLTNLQEYLSGTDPRTWTCTSPTLLSREDGAVLLKNLRPTFEWEKCHYESFKVEFSGRADFSTGMLTLSWQPETSFTPSTSEWREIRAIERTSGRVYWRVGGKDAAGNVAFSEPRSFTIEKRGMPIATVFLLLFEQSTEPDVRP
jgi:Leucine-rich repeat (LRR) protein